MSLAPPSRTEEAGTCILPPAIMEADQDPVVEENGLLGADVPLP